ncbi:MAG: MBL fold metallo-hydrolase [Desulfosarcinaceae bacterium]|nr:MBL fold metallo-hydrolase [Desulfosarcinaceae bacterium]
MPDSATARHSTDPGAASARLMACVLASGSKGNAVYLSSGETRILVDAGLSGREIERRMAERQLSAADLNAILVTHEHADHLQGVGVLSRRYQIPIHISRRTAQAAGGRLGRVAALTHFRCGSRFQIGDLEIHPFTTTHDAADSAGFTVRCNGCKAGIATDLGLATELVKRHLTGCQLLVLEANHDPQMLIDGPYPWPLKQRIRGRNGHLSNAQCRDLLGELLHPGLLHVILAHLSENNNSPTQALNTVSEALQDHATRLSAATQEAIGETIYL